MYVSVGSDNEADTHVQIVILNVEQRVGGEQSFGRTDVSTFRQGQRFRHRRELGDVRGHTAQGLF